MIAGVLLTAWRGGERGVAGVMTVGAFVAFRDLFVRFVNRGHRIPQLVTSVQSGAAAYARLRPLLAPALGVAGEPRLASFRAGHVAGIAQTAGRPTPRTPGPVAVSLRGMTLRYPGGEASALSGLNLDIPAGLLVAVTGPVGSGKSTLARSLLGIYPLESGTVLIDGHPLTKLTPEERGGLIGYLPQDALLFSGSLRENLTLGRGGEPHDDPFLLDAVRLAVLEQDMPGFLRGLDPEIWDVGFP